MRGKDWSYLLRKIPAEFHEEINIATITGVELVIKSIIRLDDDYLVIKGRPAGSNDSGLLLIVPFEQINFLSFRRPLSDEEVDFLFGSEDREGFAKMPSRMNKVSKPKPKHEPEEDSHVHNGTSAQHSEEEEEEAATGPSNASKSMLLARIRERLATDSSNNSKKR